MPMTEQQAWTNLLNSKDVLKWSERDSGFLEDLSTVKWSGLNKNQQEIARELLDKMDELSES